MINLLNIKGIDDISGCGRLLFLSECIIQLQKAANNYAVLLGSGALYNSRYY